MTDKNAAPWVRAHNGWFTCRVNEHYYREKLRALKRRDRRLRWASVFFASGGVVSALALWGDVPAGVAGVLAAGLGAYSLVAGISDEIQAASALLPQYTAIAATFRDLYYLGDDASEEAVTAAWREFDRLQVSEAEKLPEYDHSMLLRADALARKEQLGATA